MHSIENFFMIILIVTSLSLSAWESKKEEFSLKSNFDRNLKLLIENNQLRSTRIALSSLDHKKQDSFLLSYHSYKYMNQKKDIYFLNKTSFNQGPRVGVFMSSKPYSSEVKNIFIIYSDNHTIQRIRRFGIILFTIIHKCHNYIL